jgi:hypothetical protein
VTRGEYFERWATLHGGLDPRTSIPVQAWLTVTFLLAKPLAALRLSPDAVTVLGMLVALTVPYWVIREQYLLAGVVALLAGLIDNLDGAVAILTDTSSDFGYVLDSVADRVGDVALLVGLGLAATNPWPAVGAALLAFLQEYARARPRHPQPRDSRCRRGFGVPTSRVWYWCSSYMRSIIGYRGSGVIGWRCSRCRGR